LTSGWATEISAANQMNEFVARKSFNDKGLFVAPPV
jgi:hypothetical protein